MIGVVIALTATSFAIRITLRIVRWRRDQRLARMNAIYEGGE